MDLALTGIELRVARGSHDEEDRHKIWYMFTNQNVSYELRDTCLKVLVQGWGSDNEFRRLALEGLRAPYPSTPSDKEPLLSFLVHSWPGDKDVAHSIASYFYDHPPHFIHNDSLWDALFTGFRCNPDISAAIRKDLNERKTKYQAIYWGPDVKREYSVIGDDAAKAELLAAYPTASNSQDKFWICSTLIEAWNNDDDVKKFFKCK